MKKYLLYILGSMLLLAACAKDKGNYTYHDIPAPTISNFDSAYSAIIGDSFIIKPVIKLNTGANNYTCHWKISVPEQLRSLDSDGSELHMVFALTSNTYQGLLTIVDNNNGQKYYYNFTVRGITIYAKGTVILSDLGSRSTLSFLSLKDTLQPDLFPKFNPTEVFPGGGIEMSEPAYRDFSGLAADKFWIRYTGAGTGAIKIDASNMTVIRHFADNFFNSNPPNPVTVDHILPTYSGTTVGVFNGQIYAGYTYTAPNFLAYGLWSSATPGLDHVSPQLIRQDNYQLVFDTKRKAMVQLVNDFKISLDTNYQVKATDSAFNPKKLGMNMVYMTRFSDDKCYAIVDSAGKKKELRFAIGFLTGGGIIPQSTTKFKGDSLITANTLWASSPLSVVYFTSNGTIYAYNLDNKLLTKLTTNFGGANITMLKMLDDGDTLVVGTEGTLTYLNLATGHSGDTKKTITGIPGSPTDILIQDN